MSCEMWNFGKSFLSITKPKDIEIQNAQYLVNWHIDILTDCDEILTVDGRACFCDGIFILKFKF